jgi:Ca-activated chloride channel family protein
METLADCGNGAYHYIDSIGEARRVLSENLVANVTPFADDVKVQVEFNPALVKAYRLIGYENRELADEDFKNDAKDAGEVGPGMQFTVAYEVALADSALEIAAPELRYGSQAGSFDTDEFACAALRYRAFADGAVHEQQLAMSAASVDAADDDWRFAASVIEFGMLLRGSEHVGTATLDGVAARLSQMQLDDERAEFASLVELARDPIYVLEDATRTPSGA